MKRLLLICALLLSLLCSAQDYEYIKTLNSLDNAGAKAFSDKVAAASATKWVFLYEKSNDKSLAEWYIDGSLPVETIEHIRQGKELFKPGQCMVVRFEVMGNAYRFTEVTAKKDDLLPTWQIIFQPAATAENIAETYKMRELKQNETGISYKFTEDDEAEYWTLKNWTYLK